MLPLFFYLEVGIIYRMAENHTKGILYGRKNPYIIPRATLEESGIIYNGIIYNRRKMIDWYNIQNYRMAGKRYNIQNKNDRKTSV